MGLAAYERALWALVSNTSLDVLHFSLHPLSAGRLSVAFALVLLHAAVMWIAVAIIRAAATATRASRHPVRALPGTIAGAIVAAAVIARWSDSIPVIPLAIAFSAAAAGAFTLGRLGVRLHRLSQSARLGVSFVALVAPAVAMYPSLYADATEAKERLVVDEYAPEAASQRDDLQRRLQRTVEQIDQVPSLAEFVLGLDIRNADNRSRVRRLVEHRPRALPPDVGHRPVRCRRPGRQFVRASPARVRDRSLQGVRHAAAGSSRSTRSRRSVRASAMSSGPAVASARTAVWSAASSCA